MSTKRTAAVEGLLREEDEALQMNASDITDGESGLQRKHIFPQVCAECHHAWMENRYRDIGRHRLEKTENFTDESCLLWNLISSGGCIHTAQKTLTMAMEDVGLGEDDSESERMRSIVQEQENNRKEMNRIEDSKNEAEGSIKPIDVEYKTAALELLSDETEEIVEPERESYDFHGVHFYTSSDEPREISNNVRVVSESKIHMPLIESWLRTCEENHPDCSKPKFSRTAHSRTNFLLIDIVAQQIIPASLSTPFVSLSYVWGGAEQFQLTKSLYPEVTKYQGLMEYEDKIPTTIKDAMAVVSGLNERYLWVDCLCIVQDDTSDKQAQIDQMAAIYDASILTIVACTATNANDPLPGVQPGKRKIVNQITRQNGILFAREEHSMLAWTLPRVSHSKRAWTFQEVLLSRRCLYFLDGEIMMQCQKSLFKESTTKVSDHEMMNQTGNWPPLANFLSNKFSRYREIVHTYTPRKLTFPKDRKDAFTGAVKAMELAWDWKFCYCMPASEDFDWALLWTGEYSTDKETQWEEKKMELSRSLGFPTWSWLSAAERAWYLNEKESAGYLQPLIDWNCTTVWDGVRTYNFLTGNGNGMESHVEGYPPGTIIIMGWVKHLSYTTQSTAEPTSAVGEEMAKQASYGAPCAPLLDANGNWCGTLNGLTRDQLLLLLSEEDAELSLVLLSSIQKSWVLGGFRRSSPPYDVEKFGEGEFKTLNVMLVKWNDRLATRVAVGEIHVDAWKDKESEPEGDLIRLI